MDILSLSSDKGDVLKAFSALYSGKITDLNAANFLTASGSDLSQRIMRLPRLRMYIPLLLVLIWISGVFISSLNIITGRIIISNLLKRAQRVKATTITGLVKEQSERMGINHNIRLLKSPQCKLPFTCGTLRPVIVVPSDIEEWQADRIRTILIHELSHIKRKDYFTKIVSRIICSIYWFIPLFE
jgi:beta-lactamase regulating signal transducer with metallopeptidase domain